MYDKLVLVSKKFYYGRVVWEDGKFLDTPKYDIKGMQAKRSDHSQLSKDFQYTIIQNHFWLGMEIVIIFCPEVPCERISYFYYFAFHKL